MQDCPLPTPVEPICNERSQINYERLRWSNEVGAVARAGRVSEPTGDRVTCESVRASRPEELLGNPKK